MFIEKRREDRSSAECPVSMVLHGKGDDGVLCDALPADVVDISKYGARLVLDSIRIDAFHLFYTPRDEAGSSLFVEGATLDGEAFSVPVWPVWFDRLQLEESRPFQMGVEFLLHPHDEQVAKLLKRARVVSGKPRGLLDRLGFTKPD